MIHATVNGTDYNIAEVEVNYSICKSKGTASFQMDYREDADFTTSDDVVIVVDGVTMFSGMVETKQLSSFPNRLQVTATSEMFKAERAWFPDEYISQGESAAHWISHFFGLASISNLSLSIPSVTVYEGHSWSLSNCIEALTNLAQITDCRIFPDRLGTIHMEPMNYGDTGDSITITYYENIEKVFSDRIIRNKVTVFGNGVTAIVSGSNSYIAPGETRATAISTGLIETTSKAFEVANHILSTFNKPLQMYTFGIEGNPSLSLNDYVNFSEYSGPITSLQHRYDESGFRSTVTIGEICPNFFGIDLVEEYPSLYLSGTSIGVWRSSDGVNWTNISGTALNGLTVPNIHWDGTYLWAVSGSNIYRGDGSSSWTTCNVLNTYYTSKDGSDYTTLKTNTRMVDIISDYLTSNRVFVVAYDEENQKTIVLFSEDKYNFNRIIIV